MSQTKPSIVFAHGIWADGSCFSKVIPTLQAEGHEVVASQHGVDTLEGDIATVRRALSRVSSPAILVGHSYGGTLITAAGTDERVAAPCRTGGERRKRMASKQVLDVVVRRYILTTERPFPAVLDGIFGGISQPDIEALFAKLGASTSYEEFSSLVQQAQGSAGLMRFLRLDLDTALALDPQARRQARRRLVRLIAGNPVTMGQMTRHVPDAGSYAPVTILIEELPDGGTRVAYDTVTSEIAPYGDAAATQVAERLDTEVLELLHQATGVPAPIAP
jgi:pimeloyl-ACP methyl ester carboxylesterase